MSRGARRAAAVAVVAAAGLVPLLFVADLRLRSAASRLPESGSRVETVAGLDGAVEVLLDRRGVPHVRASRAADLYLAQGYLHARDRFFEMELARRRATGRLAELVGRSALAADRRARQWQVAALARRQTSRLSGAEREALEAYATGVNQALERYGRLIAPEVRLLGLEPEPWRVEESLAIALYDQLKASPAATAELDRAVLVARLGRERAVELFGWSPREARAWLPPVDPRDLALGGEEGLVPTGDRGGGGCWALAPARTASGRPLVACVREARPSVPAPAYLVDLAAPGLHVAGASLPGLPGVAIGHTEGVAWAYVPAFIDDQDLYVITLDRTRGRELVDGRWRPLRTVTERIAVRWEKGPELLKVALSERGPLLLSSGGSAVAVAWTGAEGPGPVRAFLGMARARSAAEVVAAWNGVVSPAVALVAADVEGHVVHHLLGAAPLRRRGDGRLPAPGADSGWAWRRVRPLGGLYARRDPGDGLVVAAGEDPVAEGSFRPARRVAGEFAPPWRYRRLRARLRARDDWDLASSLELERDLLSGRAVALLKALLPDLDQHGGATARLLRGWDGRMEPGSAAATAYAALLAELERQVGGDDAEGARLERSPIGPEQLLRLLAGGLDERWWDDLRTREREGRREIVARALDRLDAEPAVRRPWGAVHRVEWRHPFGRLPLLGPFFGRVWSRGPYPAGGDETTVAATPSHGAAAPLVAAAPWLRFACEVGTWDEALLAIRPGESGRPWSAHFADQAASWQNAAPGILPFSDQAVAAETVARLRLVPAADRAGEGEGE